MCSAILGNDLKACVCAENNGNVIPLKSIVLLLCYDRTSLVQYLLDNLFQALSHSNFCHTCRVLIVNLVSIYFGIFSKKYRNSLCLDVLNTFTLENSIFKLNWPHSGYSPFNP